MFHHHCYCSPATAEPVSPCNSIDTDIDFAGMQLLLPQPLLRLLKTPTALHQFATWSLPNEANIMDRVDFKPGSDAPLVQ
jgi:hypothetical protein